MAERFAIGLAKTAVEGTLVAMRTAIAEELRLKVQVQQDLVFITGEFQMMRSFLKEANIERAKNEVVRTWVRQLRELAFDVEDCAELIISLSATKPCACIWSWRLGRHYFPMLRLLPLDEAIANIQELKARVVDVSQRCTRYNLLSNFDDAPGSKLEATTPYTLAAAATFQDLMEVWKTMGKFGDHITDDLKRLIDCQGSSAEPWSRITPLSLWPSPQVDVVGEHGCMSILKKAYDDPEIYQEFKNRAWVKLSTHHPFNPVKFLNDLLTQFSTSHHHHHHEDISELMLQVNKHRYLIVLEEELSSVADWNAIRKCLPDGKKGSRIVVSTKHLKIAIVCTRVPYQVSQLIHLSHDGGLYAFFPKYLIMENICLLYERNFKISGRPIPNVHFNPRAGT
ncbi:Putative disease resistance RPP13-like protein 2 [Triticum urartu]|uniref:Putative disease resistance RPP13-like protein 2 n=1 Tax=Triticum urartu TaxID=4572 RepID=M7ZAP3_TRIUA|nr:Putative disease resistance RPP13-like protein 2 [Triticum urartu]